MKANDYWAPLCAVLTFLAYSGAAIYGTFQFDDFNVIVDNEVVQHPGALLADLARGIRPILKLSYFMSWSVAPAPISFLCLNVLIHAINTLLVYNLTKSLQLFFPNIQISHALFAALLFALHPVHTEAVTYISGRSSSLMCLFYLAGLNAYLSVLHSGKNCGLRSCIVFFVLAVFTKETAMTFPAALILLELLVSRNKTISLKQILYRQRCLWFVFLGLAMTFLLSRGYSAHFSTSIEENSGVSSFLLLVNGLPYILSKWLLPIHLNIDPDLRYQLDFMLYLKLFLVIVFALLCFSRRLLQRFPFIWFALCWIYLHLFFPYLLFPRLDIYNERQLYIVSWPMILVLVLFLHRFQMRSLFVSLLCVACMIGTWLRNREYYSEVALWTVTAERSPNKSRVFNNLGYVYEKNGQLKLAKMNFLKALELDPDNFFAANNLERLKNSGSNM